MTLHQDIHGRRAAAADIWRTFDLDQIAIIVRQADRAVAVEIQRIAAGHGRTIPAPHCNTFNQVRIGKLSPVQNPL